MDNQKIILVEGSIELKTDRLAEGLMLARQHVQRSRSEPGCIAHDVYQHADNACLLVFVERWSSRDALKAHFAVPESKAFIEQISAMASTAANMEVFDARSISW